MTTPDHPVPDDVTRRNLLDHLVVPVAHEEDARRTALALRPYDPNRVTVLHVIEKGEGAIDKTPVEYSEELGRDSYHAFQEYFPEAEYATDYAKDIVPAIFAVADDVDATAVAFRPRDGGRLLRFLSGDLSLKLVTEAEYPVIALPRYRALNTHD